MVHAAADHHDEDEKSSQSVEGGVEASKSMKALKHAEGTLAITSSHQPATEQIPDPLPIDPVSIPEPPSTPPPVFIDGVLQILHVGNSRECRICKVERPEPDTKVMDCGHVLCKECFPGYWDDDFKDELPKNCPCVYE